MKNDDDDANEEDANKLDPWEKGLVKTCVCHFFFFFGTENIVLSFALYWAARVDYSPTCFFIVPTL